MIGMMVKLLSYQCPYPTTGDTESKNEFRYNWIH